MAATQQYSLRWNNYFRHLTYALENHRAENDFVDVTLICDARKIKAHKVVLSSCSAYFKEIFKENPHPHPVIIFKFIKYDDLNAIIEFMYQGEVNVQQEALQSFLQTAELLAVQGLTAEDKEKPKVPLPLIDEQKVIKTIPSTIRPITEAAPSSQPSTQPVEIPPSTLNVPQTSSQHQHVPTQLQHLQVQQHQPQAIQISSAHSLHPVVTHQTSHVSTVTPNTVTVPAAVSLPIVPVVPVSLPSAAMPDLSLPTGAIGTVPANTKKRKLTFTGEDENPYATETVDFQVKQEQNLEKPNEIPYIRGPVKMDLPEYIVSDVDEHITENSTPQNSQDGSANETNPNVSQYAPEYEILDEQEMDEKYNQSDADNSELLEMGRLLNQGGSSANTSSGNHNSLNDPHRNHDIKTKIEPPSTDFDVKTEDDHLLLPHYLKRHELHRNYGTPAKRYRCKSCYAKGVKNYNSQIARNTTKRVTTFCKDCPNKPYLCIPCFNSIHRYITF